MGGCNMQKKLGPGNLLDKNGFLEEVGYATSLIKEYHRKDIKAHPLRIKEWDYYLIYNNDIGIALTLADNSYMGLAGISFLDFQKRTSPTKNLIFLFPMGRTGLPSSSKKGNVAFENKKISLSFENTGQKRILKANMDNFYNNKPFKARVNLKDEPEESMVIATPFPENKKAFYYNQKILGMSAEGEIEFNGKKYVFSPENSLGLLDWGRGVWTYDNTWYWGAAHGFYEGKILGFNIGYGFGDTSAATENMLFFDGRAHKINDVTFHIPRDENNREDYLKPWTFSSSDNRLEMDFIPIIDRASYTSLGLILSDQHQVFGFFNGKMVLDDGTEIKVRDLLGFAEKVRNKW